VVNGTSTGIMEAIRLRYTVVTSAENCNTVLSLSRAPHERVAKLRQDCVGLARCPSVQSRSPEPSRVSCSGYVSDLEGTGNVLNELAALIHVVALAIRWPPSVVRKCDNASETASVTGFAWS
jgi:hypothetical protein